MWSPKWNLYLRFQLCWVCHFHLTTARCSKIILLNFILVPLKKERKSLCTFVCLWLWVIEGLSTGESPCYIRWHPQDGEERADKADHGVSDWMPTLTALGLDSGLNVAACVTSNNFCAPILALKWTQVLIYYLSQRTVRLHLHIIFV